MYRKQEKFPVTLDDSAIAIAMFTTLYSGLLTLYRPATTAILVLSIPLP